MIVSLIIIMICSSCIKFITDLNETLLLAIFLIEIFFVGNAYNLAFTLQNEQVDPKLLGVSFEMIFSCGILFSAVSPIVAKLAEPIPTIFLTSLCLAAILIMFTFRNPEFNAQNLRDESIESTLQTIVINS